MATNQSSPKGSDGMRKRFHRAVNGSPAFRSLHRGSHCSQSPISASNSPPKLPTSDGHDPAVANKTRVPIEFAPQTPEIGKENMSKIQPLVQSPNNITITYNHSQEKPAKKVTMVEDQEPSQEKGGHREAKFSEFINRVRDNITRTTTIQGGDGGGINGGPTMMRRDSVNDKVSHFINRAILKIRTSSNLGADDHGN